jgi:undecaprenyl-diphosphatase
VSHLGSGDHDAAPFYRLLRVREADAARAGTRGLPRRALLFFTDHGRARPADHPVGQHVTDPILLLQAVLLGIVEGLTEFLPVSSTGHLILTDWVIGFEDPTGRAFHVVIQLGAIAAICVLYFSRLWRVVLDLPTSGEARYFVATIIVAFLPAALLGVLFHDFIKNVLFSPWVVPVTLILGGIVILLIERAAPVAVQRTTERLPLRLALLVGCCQALAMIPGVSRSGATILGAVVLKVERRTAAEFSFFLAIPTMLGAATYDLWQNRLALESDGMLVILVGFVAAFLAAMLVVRALLAYLARHTFEIFGWYRIAAGLIMLAVLAMSTSDVTVALN